MGDCIIIAINENRIGQGSLSHQRLCALGLIFFGFSESIATATGFALFTRLRVLTSVLNNLLRQLQLSFQT